MSQRTETSSKVDEFLLAEYEHFADSFWRTEELGEKRLNFFISLLTAAVAGLVLLATKESGLSDGEVRWTAFGTGVALLLLGISTLLRMLRRNNVSDQYKRAMGLIRQSFATRYVLLGYEPFGSQSQGPLPRRLFTGGLAQTAALLNAIIAAALTAIGLFGTTSAPRVAVAATIMFLVAAGAQFAYIHLRHKRG